MKVFKLHDIEPIEVRLNGYIWIEYSPYLNDNNQIEKGVLIQSDEYGLLEVKHDVDCEAYWIAICKPHNPEQYPAEFVETLADDVRAKYIEWIKTNK